MEIVGVWLRQIRAYQNPAKIRICGFGETRPDPRPRSDNFIWTLVRSLSDLSCRVSLEPYSQDPER